MLPFHPPSSRQDLQLVDPIYSDSTILLSSEKDAVLIDLINSQTFQRLKSVGQHGISSLSGHLKGDRVTRFDHSIGEEPLRSTSAMTASPPLLFTILSEELTLVGFGRSRITGKSFRSKYGRTSSSFVA